MMKNKATGAKMKHKAFTLVELIVVVAIIGVLAWMLLPALEHARKKTQVIQAKQEVEQQKQAEQDKIFQAKKEQRRIKIAQEAEAEKQRLIAAENARPRIEKMSSSNDQTLEVYRCLRRENPHRRVGRADLPLWWGMNRRQSL